MNMAFAWDLVPVGARSQAGPNPAFRPWRPPNGAEAVVRTGQPVRSTPSAPAEIDGVYAGGG